MLERIKHYADLSIKPSPISKNHGNIHCTLGDLHANAVKLIYYLVYKGIVDISDDDYKKLTKAYNNHAPRQNQAELTKNNVEEISGIIGRLAIKNHQALLRLIGDEVADRGKNDLFILLLLKKLKTDGVKYEILVSNHGIELLRCFTQGTKYASPVLGANFNQAASMDNMQLLINQKIVDRAEIDELIKEVYIPALKLISYSVDPDRRSIRLYTHAPVDLNVIEKVAERLNVTYDDSTIEKLAETIDKINQAFHTNYLSDKTKLNDLFGPDKIMNEQDPLSMLIWNRNYNLLDRVDKKNGYSINYIHGHDSTPTKELHVHNLDNLLGKPGFDKGTLEDLHTFGFSLKSLDNNHADNLDTIIDDNLDTIRDGNLDTIRDKLLECISNYKKQRFSDENKEKKFSRTAFGFSVDKKATAVQNLEDLLYAKGIVTNEDIKALRDGNLGNALRTASEELARDLNMPQIKGIRNLINFIQSYVALIQNQTPKLDK